MFEQTFKNVDDILHKDAGCGSELDYVEQTSWVLFLKYLDDLEELRSYREELIQLGESIFTLNDITKVTKLWESTTIFSFIGVIALLYNYMYFIFRGQKPIIPVVTKTVQRMMIDRNGKEY